MRLWVPLVSAGCTIEVPIGTIDTDPPDVPETPVLDRDEDKSPEELDCDDRNGDVHPGAPEICDGIDNNCDDTVDWVGSDNKCERYDEFTQELKSDILVVWDDSGDMIGSYDELAAYGAGAMARHLVGTGSDTHIGFTTTAPDAEQGVLQVPDGFNGPPWLQGNAANITLAQAFDFFHEQIDQQYGGMGNEDSVRKAIARAIDLSESRNAGFFRPEASLNIVVLSNEEDTQEPLNLELLSLLGNFKGSMSMVRVFAVTNTQTSSCEIDQSPADSIVALVEQTGGFYETVCMPDWRGFLSSVGQSIAARALKNTFVLDEPALLGTIEITVFPAVGEEYTWDAGFALTDAYTLVFPDARPPAGSRIHVKYERDWRF